MRSAKPTAYGKLASIWMVRIKSRPFKCMYGIMHVHIWCNGGYREIAKITDRFVRTGAKHQFGNLAICLSTHCNVFEIVTVVALGKTIVYHRDSRLRGRCILMVLANNDRPIITAFLPPWSVGAAHVPVQNYQYVEFDSDGHHGALSDWKMFMWLVPRYYATTVHLNARVSQSIISNRRIQCESFNWVEADWSFPPQMYVMYYGPRKWTFA